VDTFYLGKKEMCALDFVSRKHLEDVIGEASNADQIED